LMEEIAKEHGGLTISQVALAWMLADPVISSPIIGPRTMDQLQDNLGVAGIKLDEDEKQALDQASQ
jgi:aryl-alcohol dehydrogenase-like predicted oxidoreductase